jgi:hypothetical protein
MKASKIAIFKATPVLCLSEKLLQALNTLKERAIA